MIRVSGEDLDKRIEMSLCRNYRERFLIKQLHSFVTGENDHRILCLFGLRRTGKTVMMMHEIDKLDSFEQCLFIECEDNDSMMDVRNAIDEFSECKYVFIDEITKVKNFSRACSFLADHYAFAGRKIVVTGTDSLGFIFASSDELFDRMCFIHTTYVSFKEFNFLLGKGIEDYLKYGGTLTDGEVFYNKDNLNEYTNSAIVNNVLHSLQRWHTNEFYGVLDSAIEHGDLESIINKVLEVSNRRFLARVINKDFKSHDLGSLVNLMTIRGIGDAGVLDTDSVSERIRIALRIKEQHFDLVDDKVVTAIIKYLKVLDVLYEFLDFSGNTEYLFTQIGMRYCQLEGEIDALNRSQEFSVYNAAQKREIITLLKSDVCGRLMEDVVFYQLHRDYSSKDFLVTKYSNDVGCEVDALLCNFRKKSCVAMEVKFSDKQDKGQCKHLLNQEFCKEIETEVAGVPIVRKVVVYRGKSLMVGAIEYVNVEEFLTNTKVFVDSFFKHSEIGGETDAIDVF
jgi:hypothetical protein